MRIVAVQLTQTEAADAAVMRNILTLLAETDGEVQIALGNGAAATPLLPAPTAAGAALPPTAPETNSVDLNAKAAAAFGGAQGAPVPMTPPAGSAGPGTMPPAPNNGPAVGQREVDAAGWPWDPRIHAEPPTKTDKGLWRASRKAGAAASRPQIESELRALGFGVVNPPPPPPPVQQPGLTPEQQAQLLAAQVQSQAQPPAPQPQPPAPAPLAPVGVKRSFEALMMRVQHGVLGKIIRDDWLKTSYLAAGVQNMGTLMMATGDNGTRDVVSELHSALDQYEIPDHVRS